MFDILRGEIDRRLLVCRQQLALIARLESEHNDLAAVAKGMYFVQLYAVYEYSLKASVRALVSSLIASNPVFENIRHEVLSLVLDSMWDSAGKAGKESKWEARIALSETIRSTRMLTLTSDIPFPADGSHYRVRQLHTVWKVFGLDEPIVPVPKHMGRVEELVDNRNYVAHGEKPPEEVGRRFSQPDLVQRTDDVAAIVEHFVRAMEQHGQTNGLLLNADLASG